MMQVDAFDPPIARKRDPETSKAAAAAYDGNQRSGDKALLMDVIRRRPCHTAAEYSEILRDEGLHWYTAARMPTKRVHDLVVDGSVVVAGRRQCRVTRRDAQVYRIA